MSDLLVLESPALPATIEAEVNAARTFAANEKAAATRRAYRSDFAIFAAWCQTRGLTPLPASSDTVAAFLAALATAGAKASTIGRKAAAIRYAHVLDGHEPPTSVEAVKAVMRGIRRTIGAAKSKKAPATADLLGPMLDLCPDTIRGARDRALLALGFAGAFRRSELVALTVEDITEGADGFRVVIRHSKTDQEAHGQEIAILAGAQLRPVQAVRAWLQAAQITDGPVFRAVSKGGKVSREPLTDRSVANIVKVYALRVGLDPADFAGHSLRAGFLTSAAEHGASVFKMMEVSRHKSVDTLRGYVRSADLFKDHAGRKFL